MQCIKNVRTHRAFDFDYTPMHESIVNETWWFTLSIISTEVLFCLLSSSYKMINNRHVCFQVWQSQNLPDNFAAPAENNHRAWTWCRDQRPEGSKMWGRGTDGEGRPFTAEVRAARARPARGLDCDSCHGSSHCTLKMCKLYCMNI